jgi:hypothetical protein
MADNAEQVREVLRQWISADDEVRALQTQIKGIRDRKVQLSAQVLEFMRGNNLDNFVIEGGAGTIARQQRTVRTKPNKSVVRSQIAILLADQPQRMVEVLRTIEGIPEPGQEDTASVTTRELLTRRLPRTQHINLGQ